MRSGAENRQIAIEARKKADSTVRYCLLASLIEVASEISQSRVPTLDELTGMLPPDSFISEGAVGAPKVLDVVIQACQKMGLSVEEVAMTETTAKNIPTPPELRSKIRIVGPDDQLYASPESILMLIRGKTEGHSVSMLSTSFDEISVLAGQGWQLGYLINLRSK